MPDWVDSLAAKGRSNRFSYKGGHLTTGAGNAASGRVFDPSYELAGEFRAALQRIIDAPIVHEPFPHLSVPQLFSDAFYTRLVGELPSEKQYVARDYAGTYPVYQTIVVDPHAEKAIRVPQDCSPKPPLKRGEKPMVDGVYSTLAAPPSGTAPGCRYEFVRLHDTGLKTGRSLRIDEDPQRYSNWWAAFDFLHSPNFTHTLFERLSLPNGEGVPPWKRKLIRNRPNALHNSAAIRIEPSQYHLTPHVDLSPKIVTWQLFHPPSHSLSDMGVGTYFYRPKPGLNFRVDDQKNPSWLDFRLFDRALEHRCLPNYFFAFAPNNKSWHGANITKAHPVGKQRRTLLGFLSHSDVKM